MRSIALKEELQVIIVTPVCYLHVTVVCCGDVGHIYHVTVVWCGDVSCLSCDCCVVW